MYEDITTQTDILILLQVPERNEGGVSIRKFTDTTTLFIKQWLGLEKRLYRKGKVKSDL